MAISLFRKAKFLVFCCVSLAVLVAQISLAQGVEPVSIQTVASSVPSIVFLYFDARGRRVATKDSAEHHEEMIYQDSVGGKHRIYFPSGKLRREIAYRNFRKGTKYGIERSYYETGEIKSQSEFGPKGPVGPHVQFYRNGKVRISVKPKNCCVGLGRGEAFGEDGKPMAYNPLNDKLPSLGEGGLAAIVLAVQKRAQYPLAAQQAGISGRVLVGFMVNDAGYVGNVCIMKTASPLFNATVMQAVGSLPRFTPGESSGTPVDVFFTVPVTFRLQ